MSNPDLASLLNRFKANGRLPEAACRAVISLPFAVRNVPPGTYLVRESDAPTTCFILLSGFAFRHKIVGDGGRQIVALNIPGEALDLQSVFLAAADHNVQTLTEATLAAVPMAAMRQLIDDHPALARAALHEMLVEASILREWIANVGRRDARTRIAHLLCEFAARLDRQGISSDTYELPMTQEQIGDALGLTSVHVNRSLKRLVDEGLITREQRAIRVPDVRALRRQGDFNSLYLHLDEQGGLGPNA